MSTTLCAERPYAIGDVIVELQGASWSLDHASGAFCILTQSASIRLQTACIESYNAVYVGPFVDAVIATKKIEQGSPIALFTCLVAYHFHQVVPCPCGCGRMLKGFSGLSDTEKQALTFLTEPDVRRAAYADGYVVQTSKKDLIEARPNGEMGLAMYALQPILKGTELFQCGGLLVPRATMYTIQVAQDKHSLFGDGAECIAHSCDPNVVVVPHPNPSHTEAFVFVAYRDIQAGELLGFNYQSTEWLMQQAFTCLCGSKECFGTIGGFSNATEEQRSRMWPYATNVMKNLVSPPKLN